MLQAQAEEAPWTATLPTWVTVLLVLGTGGYFLLALGLYLAFWVRRRRRQGHAFALYFVCTVLTVAPYLHLPAIPVFISDLLDGLALSGFFIAPFALRYDLQRYFLENRNSNIEMSPFWTFLFGSGYINYCLAVVLSGEGTTGSATSIFPSR